jgi:hypothetical protein
MKSILSLIILFFCLNNFFGQSLEVTHQSNGTTISVPIESIDSVIFEFIPPPSSKKIYQNNGGGF